jgi:hypothetical protein
MTVYRTCHNFQYMHEFVLQCSVHELTATMTHRGTVIGLLMATVSSIAVDVSHDMCIDKFHDFVDDSTCPDGLVKFMVGGKYSIEFEKKLGSKLWIETRQRADDKFPTVCKHD